MKPQAGPGDDARQRLYFRANLLEVATVTGSVAEGYVATLTVAV